MRRSLPLIVLILIPIHTGCDNRPAPPVARPVPRPGGERVDPTRPPGTRPEQGPSRCPEQERTTFIVQEDGRAERSLPSSEAIAGDGSFVFSEGRHAGQRGLPMTALIQGREDLAAVEIVPCSGDPVRLTVSQIQDEPARYLLALNQRGAIKLLDRKSETPLARNLAAFRLIRR